jgi:hypothetical protein
MLGGAATGWAMIYEVVILYQSPIALADAVRRFTNAGVKLEGAADHEAGESTLWSLVSKS